MSNVKLALAMLAGMGGFDMPKTKATLSFRGPTRARKHGRQRLGPAWVSGAKLSRKAIAGTVGLAVLK